MIHVLKKGGITMSHWANDSKFNWMKHRILDYREPIDSIKIMKDYYRLGGELGKNWTVYFQGENIKYVEFMFRKIYGYEWYRDDQVEKLKEDIDNLLTKADRLIIFA